MIGRVQQQRVLGAQTFAMQTPSCPPGQHWQDESAGPIRGLGACVPDRRVVLHLVTPPPAAPAPAQSVSLPGLTLPTVTASPPSSSPARAAAPCPDVWPWWWILLAAAAGGAAGYYAGKNPKKVKKNAGAVANAVGGRIVHRATNAAMTRFF